MPFTDSQTKALAAKLSAKHVKTRQHGGVTLSYIEGWHAIAEANRIFGFDAWDRETVSAHNACGTVPAMATMSALTSPRCASGYERVILWFPVKAAVPVTGSAQRPVRPMRAPSSRPKPMP